jgi:ABC-type branched-subunit amino acid transport system substrate-binding protein/predicted aspartyl protease
MLDEPLAFTGPKSQTADLVDLEEIRIGLLAPDKPEHPVGHALTRGALLAVEQANTAGGYQGVPFKLVRRWADDPWTAGAKEVIHLVYEDQVWAMIGSVDGAATHVAQQIVTKAHLALVSPISSDPSLTHVRVPWIFRLAPDDQAQARVLVEEIVSRGLQQVGMVTGSGHDGYTVATELTREMERRGVAPAFRLPVQPDTTEYESLVSRVAAFSPGGLIVHLAPAETRAMIEALGLAGVDCPILLPWVPGTTLDRFRPSYPGPLVNVEPFAEPRRCGPYLKLVHAYTRRFGSYPAPSAAYGYDAARLIIEAICRGGLERRQIRDQLAGLTGFAGATGTIEWDNGGGNWAQPGTKVITGDAEPVAPELQLPPWVRQLGYQPGELLEIEVGEYGYPYVSVAVNGRQIKLAIDTGNMTGLLLSPQAATELGLKTIGSSHHYDSAGKVIGSPDVYEVETLDAFGQVWTGEVAHAHELSTLAGLIGPKYLLERRFTIDYQRRLMAVTGSQLGKVEETVILPMIRSPKHEGLILVAGQVNGRQVVIELDTGKSRTVVDTEIVRSLQLPAAKNGYRIDEIRLGQLVFKAPSAKEKSFKGISKGLEKAIGLGIGSDLLAQVVLTVDYRAGMVVLQEHR